MHHAQIYLRHDMVGLTDLNELTERTELTELTN